jgi:hypothetical protein
VSRVILRGRKDMAAKSFSSPAQQHPHGEYQCQNKHNAKEHEISVPEKEDVQHLRSVLRRIFLLTTWQAYLKLLDVDLA